MNDRIEPGCADVRIAELGLEHAENMARWMKDPEVSLNLGLRSEPSPEKTRDWLLGALEASEARGYAILMDARHVGNLVFDRFDDYLGSARLSMYIGEPDARGRGVGARALELGLAQAFGRWSLHKVWLIVHVHNTRAIRAYLRAGFAMEGILRDEFRLNGRLVPAFYMGLLQTEFHSNAGDSA